MTQQLRRIHPAHIATGPPQLESACMAFNNDMEQQKFIQRTFIVFPGVKSTGGSGQSKPFIRLSRSLDTEVLVTLPAVQLYNASPVAIFEA